MLRFNSIQSKPIKCLFIYISNERPKDQLKDSTSIMEQQIHEVKGGEQTKTEQLPKYNSKI